MAIQIWVMGETGLVDSSGSPIRLVSRRAWGLLAYLAQARGRAVARTRLAQLFWPNSGGGQAKASLRQELAVTRKALRAAGLDVLDADKETVRFRDAGDLTDSAALEMLASSGDLDDLRGAVELYRGPLLEGGELQSEPFMDWLEAERARLAGLIAGVCERLLAAEEAAGEAQAAAEAAEAWLEIDPAAEPAHRALMRGFAAAGRRSDALRQFEVCAAVLRRETGQAPADETVSLAEEIRNAVDAPEPPPAAQPAPAADAATIPRRSSGVVLVAQLPEIAMLDPRFEPAAIAQAQTCFAEFASRVIEDTGGWLLPGIGDRIVAVFAEAALADAVVAALLLTEEPVPLDQGQPVSPACGVAAGLLIRSDEGTLAGVALHGAARAAAFARPGEVLAFESHAARLSTGFEIADGPAGGLVSIRAEAPAPAPPARQPPSAQNELEKIWRAWGAALVRAELRMADSYVEQAAAQHGDGQAVATIMQGTGHFLRGQLGAAEAQLVAAQDLYSSSEPMGLDPGLCGRTELAWLRCLSGAPGRAGEALRRALSEAQGLNRRPTTLMCLLVAVQVQDELGEIRAALGSARAACEMAEERPQWHALANAVLGRCQDRIGDPDGVQKMADALKRYRGAGGALAVPMILGWLAASRLETGDVGDGIALVDEALREAAASGLRLHEPEHLRLRAVLLARQGQTGRDGLEAAFATAIEAAERSGAGLFLLRGSVSFAAYLRGLGRLRDANARLDRGLAAVVPGGGVSADLKSARALKNRLAIG